MGGVNCGPGEHELKEPNGQKGVMGILQVKGDVKVKISDTFGPLTGHCNLKYRLSSPLP
jgi:hypothetical protein